MYKDEVFMCLPSSPLSGVMVRPIPARVLLALLRAGAKGVTSQELEQQCNVSPSYAISLLRAGGARIDTYPAAFSWYRGRKYVGKTKYVYLHWDPEAPNIYTAFSAKEEGQP